MDNEDFKSLSSVQEQKANSTPQVLTQEELDNASESVEGVEHAVKAVHDRTAKPQSKAAAKRARKAAKAQGVPKVDKLEESTLMVDADSQVVEMSASIAKLNAELEAIDNGRGNGETLMQRLAKSTPIMAEIAKLEASKSERIGELAGVAITSEASKLLRIDLGIDSKVNAKVVVNPDTLAKATAIFTLIRLAKVHGITEPWLVWNQSVGDEANPTTSTSFKVGEAAQKPTRKGGSGGGGGGRKMYSNGTVTLGSKELFTKIVDTLPSEFVKSLEGTIKAHAYGNVIDAAIANGHLKGYSLVVKDS